MAAALWTLPGIVAVAIIAAVLALGPRLAEAMAIVLSIRW